MRRDCRPWLLVWLAAESWTWAGALRVRNDTRHPLEVQVGADGPHTARPLEVLDLEVDFPEQGDLPVRIRLRPDSEPAAAALPLPTPRPTPELAAYPLKFRHGGLVLQRFLEVRESRCTWTIGGRLEPVQAVAAAARAAAPSAAAAAAPGQAAAGAAAVTPGPAEAPSPEGPR